MNTYHTRLALSTDAARIAEIYNQGIADRVATFETRPRSQEDILAWFREPYPIIACTDEHGEIAAFANLSRYRARECYAGVAEFSVYVAREARGRGLGRPTMETLIEAARERGFWKLLSRVFVENQASRKLLAKLGFREVGIYEKHAQLDGVWRDVVIVELVIAENLV